MNNSRGARKSRRLHLLMGRRVPLSGPLLLRGSLLHRNHVLGIKIDVLYALHVLNRDMLVTKAVLLLVETALRISLRALHPLHYRRGRYSAG